MATRKNTARVVPLLEYVRGKGEASRMQMLEDEDSPVYGLDLCQFRQLLNRMLDNGYFQEVRKGVYTITT